MLGTFFEFGTADMDLVLAYAGDLISDLTPLLIIIVAVSIGLIVIGAIINALKR